MKALVHLAYATAIGAVAALVAGEWTVLLVVVGMAAVIFQIARVIPGDSLRVKAMAWWLPPAVLLLVLWERWRG